jgi:hypothetical protein
MSYQATAINVMIASPGDVAAERQIIQALIHNWNSIHSEERQIVLMPLMWETHSTPEIGDRAQAIINRQVLDRCDLLVAVFWTRLGSPTGSSPSGTAEEIRKHVESGKPAMVYFALKPVELDSVDMSQYEALKSFRAECEKSGLIATYSTLQEFTDSFSRHLAQVVRDRFTAFINSESPNDTGVHVSVVAELSEAAKSLLIAAASGTGEVLRIRVMAGTVIQAGRQPMATLGDRRDEAKWESAIQELVARNLLEPRGNKGELFTVTYAGYTAVDTLKAEMPYP